MSTYLLEKNRPPKRETSPMLHIILADVTKPKAPEDVFTLKYTILQGGEVSEYGTHTTPKKQAGHFIAGLATVVKRDLEENKFAFRLDNGFEHQRGETRKTSKPVPTKFLIPFCEAVQSQQRRFLPT